MKLSVSAFRAQASAHKKILKAHNYQSTLNYGSTSQSKVEVMLDSPGDGFEQQKVENPSGDGGGQKLSVSGFAEKNQSTSPSILTPRELSKDDEEDISTASSSDRRECSPSRRRWRYLHSVVEFYTRLRKVQRNKSNQRWMKLRTTVQLSGAIQTIQKKPQLKREDSFLKRFSTRQIAETQETLDTGDDDEDLEDDDFDDEDDFSYGCSGARSRCCRTKSHDVDFKLNEHSRSTVKSSSAVQGSGKDNTASSSTPFQSWLDKWFYCLRQESSQKTENPVRTRRRHRRHRRRHKPVPLPKTVVNPDSDFYFHWLFLLSICVLYNLWTLIVRQSFPELQNKTDTFWRICDGVSDVVFVLDLIVQLRTGYLEQGLMVYDARKLAGHYIRSRAFLLDVCSLFPLDLLQYKFGTNPILRCPRFLKVYRTYAYYYMVESRTVYPNLWRVVNLIHILLILAHWFGCFYYLLSEAEEFKGAWVYPFREKGYDSLTRKYLGSLYWSTLTLTTIGDLPTPETNAELNATTTSFSTPSTTTTAAPITVRRGHKSRLLQFNSNAGYVFTIASYLIGVFIFATIVGQVGNVITNRNANRLEFERLLDGAKTYMRQHKVPGGMKRRVLRWYDYSWSRGRIQGGGDINTALGLLPDKLKTELALHVNLSVLKKVTIFQECQPEFLHDLVLKMKAYIFTPGDLICRKGEVAREMFIIADGILEVISETGRVLTTMKAGDFFGEIGILNLDGLNKRTADVRSVGYSELFSLSREDVLAAMKDYPDAQEILHSLGRKRLMEAKNLNKGKKSSNPTTSGPSQISLGKDSGNSSGPLLTSQHSIVERLRSDVRGLKNVLKKTRRQSRLTSADDSLEMQSLSHDGSSGLENPMSSMFSGRPPPLRRMSRVESSEESTTTPNNNHQQSTSTISHPPQQPLGAGLPLLARLRLLKERQDREENCLLSPSPISPPSIKLEPPTVIESTSNETNIIKNDEKSEEQPGLPLLQKIMLLKAKEDAEKQKLHETAHETASVLASTTQSTPPASKKQPSWSVLRKAAIVSGNPQDHETNTNISSKITISSHTSLGRQIPTKIHPKRKPEPLRLIDPPKRYTSIDDLSPEYSGLPFVKKLKILNERQKLAELERLRASSLDSASAPSGRGTSSPETLARCHSEASAIEYVRQRERRRNEEFMDSAQISPESNETAERRNLKSILKKLSASNLFESGSPRVKKLLRAPTIEGYAVRHSKLAKSVTFNRETLQSPPSESKKQTTMLITDSNNEGNEKIINGVNHQLVETTDASETPETMNEIILKKKSQVKMPLIGFVEEECLSDILAGIKVVMNSRIEEMQNKLQGQFHSLELEIKRRDDIINKLQTRIQELESRLESEPSSPNNIPYLARGDSINTIAPSSINGQVLVDIESSSTSSTRSSPSLDISPQGETNNMWEARLLVQELAKRKAQSQQELRGFHHLRENTRRTLSLDYDITSSHRESALIDDDDNEDTNVDEDNSDEDLDECFDELQHHAW